MNSSFTKPVCGAATCRTAVAGTVSGNLLKIKVIKAVALAVLFFCTVGLHPSQAQSPAWQWATQSTGSGTTQVKNIAIDAAGNSYVVGFFTEIAHFGPATLVSQGRSDMFVAKLSPDGLWKWAIAVGGSDSDRASGVAVDAAGQVFITGSFSSQVSFGPTTLTSQGGADVFVAQVSAEGKWKWATAAGGPGTDQTCSLAIGQAGTLLVGGRFAETVAFGATPLTSLGSTDAFVACLSRNGDWQWATSAGGGDNDETTALATNEAGEIYATGYFSNTGTFGSAVLTGHGMDDAFVGKLSSTGRWLWATAATGTNTAYGKGIVADPAGGVFVTGSFSGDAVFGSAELSNSSDDGFVGRLSDSGEWAWTRVLASDFLDNIAGIALDKKGRLYVAGTFSHTIQGGAFQLTSRGQLDAFVGCLSQDGTWLGLLAGGGEEADEVKAVAMTPTGDVCVSGMFSTAATFGAVPLQSASSAVQVFVSKARVQQYSAAFQGSMKGR
jgi:hypothetical protein